MIYAVKLSRPYAYANMENIDTKVSAASKGVVQGHRRQVIRSA